MKAGTAFWLLCLIFLTSCSRDDAPDMEGSDQKLGDFTVLGEDVFNVYQYDYHAMGDEGELVNLTETNGIRTNYITLRQVGEVLTFYQFSAGSFSAVQRDVRTGFSHEIPNFYDITQTQSVIWGTNSARKIFMGYYSPWGSTNFGVRAIDLDSGETEDMMIDFNIRNVYEPLVHDDRLFVSYLDTDDTYYTAVIDIATNNVLAKLNFGSSAQSILINDIGEIGIITGRNSNAYTYTAYDFNSLTAVEEQEFTLNRFFAPGPLEAELIDRKLYYAHFYAQPSFVLFGPAIFDFVSDENTIIDMPGIVQEVEDQLQLHIRLTAIRYQAESGTFLVGYLKDTAAGPLEGGVLGIGLDGKLLANHPLPFVPTYFVK